MQKAVVNFHDSSLYEADVKAVKGSGWLTSNVVDFFFCYLEHVRYKDYLTREKVLLLHPGPLFIMAFTDDPDELKESLASLELGQQRVVMLPINDESNVDMRAGQRGSHWSLLVFERESNRFRHFDSMGTSNLAAARRVAAKVLHVCVYVRFQITNVNLFAA
jgi:sentrin-specific protease 8